MRGVLVLKRITEENLVRKDFLWYILSNWLTEGRVLVSREEMGPATEVDF